MDLESRFIECCIACNSTSQQCLSNDSPIHVQGQGDCKCNTDYRDSQNYWMEKEKKLRTKFVRDKNEFDPRQETQKKLLDAYCECFGKEDFSDKLRHEVNQENKFDSCGYCWDSPYSSWKAKADRYVNHEQSKSTVYSNNDAIKAENHLGFKEKVDFLFRIFKDYGQDLPTECFVGHKKDTPLKDGDFAYFNRRLCAAEEGIEKLALIVGDLIRDLKKKKTTEGFDFSESLDFEDMSVTQRINYLKSKNDLFLSFMKAFFKAGSVEESDSRVEFIPDSYETKPPNSPRYSERSYSNESSREEVMDMLKKLRVEMTELRQKKSQNTNDHHVSKKERHGDNGLKFSGNKLEVISEQAELVLSDESAKNDFKRKRPVQSLNDSCSPVSEDSDESDFCVQDVSPNTVPEEGEMGKSSSSFGKNNFIKSHLEDESTHSKLDSTSKKTVCGKSIKDRSKDEDERNYNTLSFSEISCSFYDSEDADKPVDRKRAHSIGRIRQKEIGEVDKSSSKDLTKPSSASGRKTDDISKKLSSGKVLQKNSYTVLLPSKLSRRGYSIPEVCSSSREENKREARGKEKELRQRPATDPSSQRKTFPPSGLKPLVQETYPKKNSGLNNVRNKNKILLSRKSCIQTS